MELVNLRTIVEGLDSLAEIEKENPKLGTELLRFTNTISNACEHAYLRLSYALGQVRGLPSRPSQQEILTVLSTLNEAPNSQWFRDVSGICNQLAVLAEEFEAPIHEQLNYTNPFGENYEHAVKDITAPRYHAHYKIAPLFSLLQRQERDLKDDIRKIVAVLQTKLGPAKDTMDVEDARDYALAVQNEISENIDQIKKISLVIADGSKNGSTIVLTPEEIAEAALQRPVSVLLLNMFFLCFVVVLGATVFQYLTVYQFILVTGFAITTVIIINALYLRTIDKLNEENFLKLMHLALLKFFSPLTHKDRK